MPTWFIVSFVIILGILALVALMRAFRGERS
jgi:hypothetical protein